MSRVKRAQKRLISVFNSMWVLCVCYILFSLFDCFASLPSVATALRFDRLFRSLFGCRCCRCCCWPFFPPCLVCLSLFFFPLIIAHDIFNRKSLIWLLCRVLSCTRAYNGQHHKNGHPHNTYTKGVSSSIRFSSVFTIQFLLKEKHMVDWLTSFKLWFMM